MDVLPLAHAGHWIWTLYVPPVAVVVFSIVKTTLSERRMAREEEKEKKKGKKAGDGAGEKSA
jgi:heme exporter protein D